jgi:hypothetical protein
MKGRSAPRDDQVGQNGAERRNKQRFPVPIVRTEHERHVYHRAAALDASREHRAHQSVAHCHFATGQIAPSVLVAKLSPPAALETQDPFEVDSRPFLEMPRRSGSQSCMIPDLHQTVCAGEL